MIHNDSVSIISLSERRRQRKTHIMKDYQSKFNKVLEHTRTPFGDRTQEIKNQSNPMPNILDLIPKTTPSRETPTNTTNTTITPEPQTPGPDIIDITTLEDKENYEPLLLAKLDGPALMQKRAEKASRIEKELKESSTLLKKRAPFGEITKQVQKKTLKKNETKNRSFNRSAYRTPEFGSTKGKKRLKCETTCHTSRSKVSCSEGVKKVTEFLTKMKKDTDLLLKELSSSGDFPIGDFVNKKNFVRKAAARSFESILKDVREARSFFN